MDHCIEEAGAVVTELAREGICFRTGGRFQKGLMTD